MQLATNIPTFEGLGPIDHFTTIVPDGASVRRFYLDVLGFELKRVQPINTGSAPDGEFDMLNWIVRSPHDRSKVAVITEGLTERSPFARYLRRYGSGVHHVAFTADDIEGTFERLRARGIATTSDAVLVDPVSKLRQFFIDRCYVGHFIEVIERTTSAPAGDFRPKNMKGLARTMSSFVGGLLDASNQDPPRSCTVSLATDLATARAYLSDPSNLGRWTAHTLQRNGTTWIEPREQTSPVVDIRCFTFAGGFELDFTWTLDGNTRTLTMIVLDGDDHCVASLLIPHDVELGKRAGLRRILGAELTKLQLEFDPSLASQVSTSELDGIIAAHRADIQARVGV